MAIPYYDGVYTGAKGYAKSLARLAYDAGIGPDDSASFQKFVASDPKAQEVLAAARSEGLADDLGGRRYEFVNHFMKNEIIPDEAKKQQIDATNKAFGRADAYKKGLGDTIRDETNALRSSLAAQLAETRGAIKQQENSKGMLYSGQRQKREGQASNLASQKFAEGAGDIVQGAEQTSADLYGQASQLRSGAQNAQSAAQGIVDRAKEARQSASSALQSQYASMLGSGIGEYAGSRASSNSNSLPQYQVLGARNTPSGGQMYS